MSPEVYFSGLHTALADLYSAETFTLTAEGDDMPPFDDDVFFKAADYIRQKGGYTSDMILDTPIRKVIEATSRVLSHAITIGIKRETPKFVTEALNNNAFIFSGLKTHTTLRELDLSLTDKSGHIKDFKEFQKDVSKINNKYNHNYLRSEYNHAVASSQMAVKWLDYERDGNDYYLQYRTADDEKVRAEHRVLNGITLPVGDPFWQSFLPPNGWNCRCNVVQVTKSKYRKSDSKKALRLGNEITNDIKNRIFRFNPGKSLKIFPDKHPYFCRKTVVCSKIRKLSSEPADDMCTACLMVRRFANDEIVKQSKRIYNDYNTDDWDKLFFDEKTGGYVVSHKKHKYNKQTGLQEKQTAKVLAQYGRRVEMCDESGTEKQFDALVDGVPTEFKIMTGPANIQKRASKAAKQGAENIVYDIQFDNDEKLYKELYDVKRKKILKQIFFVKGKKLHEYK